MIIIKRCKRDEYNKAWEYMVELDVNNEYKNRKDIYNGINPSLNKEPLSSEIDNFCIVAYDSSIDCSSYRDGNFVFGLPIGLFSFVITPRKVIGKQLLVNKNYFNQGIGKALLLENEKTLLDNGYDKYYICASKSLNNIYMNYWDNVEPFSVNEKSDIYKFNIDLKRDDLNCFNKLYIDFVINNKNINVVTEENRDLIKNMLSQQYIAAALENNNVNTCNNKNEKENTIDDRIEQNKKQKDNKSKNKNKTKNNDNKSL